MLEALFPAFQQLIAASVRCWGIDDLHSANQASLSTVLHNGCEVSAEAPGLRGGAHWAPCWQGGGLLQVLGPRFPPDGTLWATRSSRSTCWAGKIVAAQAMGRIHVPRLELLPGLDVPEPLVSLLNRALDAHWTRAGRRLRCRPSVLSPRDCTKGSEPKPYIKSACCTAPPTRTEEDCTLPV